MPPTVMRTPRRRWPWLLAAAVLLITAYPATAGPAVYCYYRGWIPGWHLSRLYRPVTAAFHETPLGAAVGYGRYLDWWYAQALRHTDGKVRPR